MRVQPTNPTGLAQTFGVHETFFSTTDQRGIITAGNAVFARISGHPLNDLLGKPHNIIRHPSMPRSVFRLLWETIKAGQSFMGYVVNHAKSGNHYWVYAIITPIPSGYLSVRFKPTHERIASIDPLYRELSELETQTIADGGTESDASAASAAELLKRLSALGFPDYEAFAQESLISELKARDVELAHRRQSPFPTVEPARADLAAMYQKTHDAYIRLGRLQETLEAFRKLAADIRRRQQAVLGIATQFRISAMNAQIAAEPLGDDGRTIGTIAELLNSQARTLGSNIDGFIGSVGDTLVHVGGISSGLCIARVQLEMMLGFIHEIAGSRSSADAIHQMEQDLRDAFARTIAHLGEDLHQLQRVLPRVDSSREQLRRDILFLQIAQMSGRAEVARLRDSGALNVMFDDLRQEIERAHEHLVALGDIASELVRLSASTPTRIFSVGRELCAAS